MTLKGEYDINEAGRKSLNRMMSNMISMLQKGDMFQLFPIPGILFNGDTGEILDVNQSFTDHLGWVKEDVQNTTFFEICHPDDIEKTELAFKEFKDNIRPQMLFYNRYRSKGGEYKPMYWIKQRKDDPNIEGMFNFAFALPSIEIAEIEI